MDVGLTHVALTVRDPEASTRFYGRYADMEVVHRRVDPDSGHTVLWLSDRRRPFAVVLIEADRAEPVLDGTAHLGVAVASRARVDELAAQAAAEGCLVLPPVDGGIPVGYWAILADPDGHHLELSFGQEVGRAVGGAPAGGGPT